MSSIFGRQSKGERRRAKKDAQRLSKEELITRMGGEVNAAVTSRLFMASETPWQTAERIRKANMALQVARDRDSMGSGHAWRPNNLYATVDGKGAPLSAAGGKVDKVWGTLAQPVEAVGRDSTGKYCKLVTAGTPEVLPNRSREEILAMERAIVDYSLTVPTPEALTKPITYALTRDGICEIRRGRIGISYAKVEGEIPGLEVMPRSFTLQVPKIPWDLFAQSIAFFYGVQERKGSSCESYVEVWYNPIAPGCYHVVVPVQEVSGGSVVHTGDYDPTGKEIFVLGMHSHGTMSPFFSSTDDHDEKRCERVYAVVGDLDRAIPTVKFRVRAGSAFIEKIPLGDIVDLPQEPLTLVLPWKDVLQGKQAGSPFNHIEVPKEWYERVIWKTHGMVRYGGIHGDKVGSALTPSKGDNRLPIYYSGQRTDGEIEWAAMGHQVEGMDAPPDSLLVRGANNGPASTYEQLDGKEGTEYYLMQSSQGATYAVYHSGKVTRVIDVSVEDDPSVA